MLESVGNNIKTVIINVFHVFENLEERLNILNKDMEDKKFQTEILEAKPAISSEEKHTGWN